MKDRFFVFETMVYDSGKPTEYAEVVHIEEHRSLVHARDAAGDDKNKQVVVMQDMDGATFWDFDS